MPQKKHQPEEIVAKLRQVDVVCKRCCQSTFRPEI